MPIGQTENVNIKIEGSNMLDSIANLVETKLFQVLDGYYHQSINKTTPKNNRLGRMIAQSYIVYAKVSSVVLRNKSNFSFFHQFQEGVDLTYDFSQNYFTLDRHIPNSHDYYVSITLSDPYSTVIDVQLFKNDITPPYGSTHFPTLHSDINIYCIENDFFNVLARNKALSVPVSEVAVSNGETKIADSTTNVTVLFADLEDYNKALEQIFTNDWVISEANENMSLADKVAVGIISTYTGGKIFTTMTQSLLAGIATEFGSELLASFTPQEKLTETCIIISTLIKKMLKSEAKVQLNILSITRSKYFGQTASRKYSICEEMRDILVTVPQNSYLKGFIFDCFKQYFFLMVGGTKIGGVTLFNPSEFNKNNTFKDGNVRYYIKTVFNGSQSMHTLSLVFNAPVWISTYQLNENEVTYPPGYNPLESILGTTECKKITELLYYFEQNNFLTKEEVFRDWKLPRVIPRLIGVASH